ncbi:MBL fold metallo-hydrolase [Methanococcoides sp. AM1]|uniref:MBL fold metallo-hydrolase n=1 Tax=Methanococcoides sp. AM1 TaxID=1201011 RepID=UPI001082484B|nr:MBL fold metallo-hydrolase [Methanococcoides sp. AM1]
MKVQRINTSPYASNSYIINGKILIDPGMDTNKLIQKLEELTEPKNIELVILTHGHFDHSAAAKPVAELCDAPIAIHKDDAASLKSEESSASMLFSSPAPDFEPDILYENGDIVRINDTEALQVIHTPGHTPGGISLYEPYSKGLFSGDTVFPNGGIGRTDFAGGNMEDLSRSIEKLTELDVITLYPGHGPVTSEDVNKQIRLSLQMSKTFR